MCYKMLSTLQSQQLIFWWRSSSIFLTEHNSPTWHSDHFIGSKINLTEWQATRISRVTKLCIWCDWCKKKKKDKVFYLTYFSSFSLLQYFDNAIKHMAKSTFVWNILSWNSDGSRSSKHRAAFYFVNFLIYRDKVL